jgi:thioredoxin 1
MVKKITGDSFLSEIKEGASVVDFSAVWCGPCQMLAPVMEELAEELSDKISFLNIDIDENPDLTMQYRIQGVPALIMFKDGLEAARQIGFLPKKEIKEWLLNNL